MGIGIDLVAIGPLSSKQIYFSRISENEIKPPVTNDYPDQDDPRATCSFILSHSHTGS